MRTSPRVTNSILNHEAAELVAFAYSLLGRLIVGLEEGQLLASFHVST